MSSSMSNYFSISFFNINLYCKYILYIYILYTIIAYRCLHIEKQTFVKKCKCNNVKQSITNIKKDHLIRYKLYMHDIAFSNIILHDFSYVFPLLSSVNFFFEESLIPWYTLKAFFLKEDIRVYYNTNCRKHN